MLGRPARCPGGLRTREGEPGRPFGVADVPPRFRSLRELALCWACPPAGTTHGEAVSGVLGCEKTRSCAAPFEPFTSRLEAPTGCLGSIGFVYLAIVLDVFSRRVVGWSMANHLRTERNFRLLRKLARCISRTTRNSSSLASRSPPSKSGRSRRLLAPRRDHVMTAWNSRRGFTDSDPVGGAVCP